MRLYAEPGRAYPSAMPVQMNKEQSRRANRRDLLIFGSVWLVIGVASAIAVLLGYP